MKLSSKFEQPKGKNHRTALSSPQESSPAPSAAARNLAMAHHIGRLIDCGIIEDYTHAARILSVSQPRMTHLMSLLLLSPAIQEAILLADAKPTDKELRSIARVADWQEQLVQVHRRQIHDGSKTT